MQGIDFEFPLGPRTLFTDRSDTTWLFFPMTGPMNTAGIQSVRVAMKMANSTGDLRMKPAVRYSNDRIVYDATPTDIGATTLTADGKDYGSFASLPGTVKPWAQFGYLVANISSGDPQLETCEGYFKLDTRAC